MGEVLFLIVISSREEEFEAIISNADNGRGADMCSPSEEYMGGGLLRKTEVDLPVAPLWCDCCIIVKIIGNDNPKFKQGPPSSWRVEFRLFN